MNQLADVSTWEFVSWNKVPHLENTNRFFSLKDMSKYWKNIIANSGKVWHPVQILTGRRLKKKRNHLVSMVTVLVEIVVWAYWTCIKAFPREVRGFEERRKKKKIWQPLQKAQRHFMLNKCFTFVMWSITKCCCQENIRCLVSTHFYSKHVFVRAWYYIRQTTYANLFLHTCTWKSVCE